MMLLKIFIVVLVALNISSCKNSAEAVDDSIVNYAVRENIYSYMNYCVVEIVPSPNEKLRNYGFYEVSGKMNLPSPMKVEYINGERPPAVSMKVSGYLILRPYGSPFQNYPKNAIEQGYYNFNSESVFGVLNTYKKQYLTDDETPAGMYNVFIVTAVLSPLEVRGNFEKQVVGMNRAHQSQKIDR